MGCNPVCHYEALGGTPHIAQARPNLPCTHVYRNYPHYCGSGAVARRGRLLLQQTTLRHALGKCCRTQILTGTCASHGHRTPNTPGQWLKGNNWASELLYRECRPEFGGDQTKVNAIATVAQCKSGVRKPVLESNVSQPMVSSGDGPGVSHFQPHRGGKAPNLQRCHRRLRAEEFFEY